MLDNTNGATAPKKFKIWWLAVAALLIVGALWGVSRVVANSPSAPNALIVATSTPTAMAPTEDAYPAPAQPTATQAPTLKPTDKPTDVPPTATQAPKPTATATEVPAKEPVNQDELYQQELAKLAQEPNQNRGQNPDKGVKIQVPANSSALLFAGHANVSIASHVVNVSGALPSDKVPVISENVIVVSNTTGDTAEFLITGFPATGYSTWIYRPGYVPEARKLAAVAVGNPTHCGLSGGCPRAIVWDIQWDGTTLNHKYEVMTDEFDLTLSAAPIPSVDWSAMGAKEGLFTMKQLLGQPASQIVVDDITRPVMFGVTAGKDHLLALPAGSKLVAPDGTSQDFIDAATVILTNEDADTVVYAVWLSAPGMIGHEEYRYTFDVVSAVPVLLKAQTELPSAMSRMAAPSAPSVFVFSFDGSTTVNEMK